MRQNLAFTIATALIVSVVCAPTAGWAQGGESDLRVFGYLQASFYQEYYPNGENPNTNTFTVQQLNIMLQKDLGKRWSTFVDLLVTNSYSSFRNVGTFDLQQAWVRYRRSHYLAVKGGLLIPWFNYLNEIKNKMPLLPYIIRPIVYETSFQEDVPIEEYVPQRAYVQVYGYAPVGDYKIEYAAYSGNSPNVRTNPDFGQTGLDTTSSLLFGGRIGVRQTYFQAGFSATHDEVNYLDSVLPDTLSPPLVFNGISRVRLGGDLEIEVRNFKFEGEYISVEYDDDNPDINNDKTFYYGTLGYNVSEKVFVYASYWEIKQHFNQRDASGDFLSADLQLKIPNGGVAFEMTDRITFKAATARLTRVLDYPGFGDRVSWFFAVAGSIMF